VPPATIFIVHALVYSMFGVRLFRRGTPKPEVPAVEKQVTAPHARALLAFYVFAKFVQYFGIGRAVFAPPGREMFFAPPQPIAGLAVIFLGWLLMLTALLVFRSWRIKAELAEGHELCTAGPYRFFRHPIYLGMDLLAVGTAVWLPNPIVALGAVLVVIAGDARARAEEKILLVAFGDRYRDYMARARRLIPFVY
jgi:protein-S-isoprenylcysteine O-methyltransferase Ste14